MLKHNRRLTDRERMELTVWAAQTCKSIVELLDVYDLRMAREIVSEVAGDLHQIDRFLTNLPRESQDS